MPMSWKLNPKVAVLGAGLLLLAAPAAHADFTDSLSDALGDGDSSGGSLLDSLGGGAMPSLDSVGVDNIAGVLEFCAKNNFLKGDAAGVKDKLLGQMGGQAQEKEPGYLEGAKGILGGDSDTKVDLSSSSLKDQLTEKVCDQVLKYGQSLL